MQVVRAYQAGLSTLLVQRCAYARDIWSKGNKALVRHFLLIVWVTVEASLYTSWRCSVVLGGRHFVHEFSDLFHTVCSFSICWLRIVSNLQDCFWYMETYGNQFRL